ncbi:hypothetical protein M9H77_21779 [Catharanthus roseus]|uniref:Uncharacterized protein n=1 Tax=Catharanthus roseus TaxID=4058 RepID=A0ACC0AP05_CATRO|nr:hypothetical protein M9H77_21779 [Catharanthus roseus]
MKSQEGLDTEGLRADLVAIPGICSLKFRPVLGERLFGNRVLSWCWVGTDYEMPDLFPMTSFWDPDLGWALVFGTYSLVPRGTQIPYSAAVDLVASVVKVPRESYLHAHAIAYALSSMTCTMEKQRPTADEKSKNIFVLPLSVEYITAKFCKCLPGEKMMKGNENGRQRSENDENEADGTNGYGLSPEVGYPTISSRSEEQKRRQARTLQVAVGQPTVGVSSSLYLDEGSTLVLDYDILGLIS